MALLVHVACHINTQVSKCQPVKVTSALKASLSGRSNSEGIHHSMLYHISLGNISLYFVRFYIRRFFIRTSKVSTKRSIQSSLDSVVQPDISNMVKKRGHDLALYPPRLSNLADQRDNFQKRTDDRLGSMCLDLNQVKPFSNLLHLPILRPCLVGKNSKL